MAQLNNCIRQRNVEGSRNNSCKKLRAILDSGQENDQSRPFTRLSIRKGEMIQEFKEFLGLTSVHGFQYLLPVGNRSKLIHALSFLVWVRFMNDTIFDHLSNTIMYHFCVLL